MHTNAIFRAYTHCTHQLGGYTKHSWVMVSVIVAGGPAFAVLCLAFCWVPVPILAAYSQHMPFPPVPSTNKY